VRGDCVRAAAIIAALLVLLSSAGTGAGPMRNATAWLNAAYQLKARGDLGGAVEAFRAALAAGAEPQRIAIELAHTHLALGETEAARDELVTASCGPDAKLAEQARNRLAALPGAWWSDDDADARGLVLAAPRPSPRLAHQVAELFIERAIAWRVLARPEYALANIAPHRTGLEAI